MIAETVADEWSSDVLYAVPGGIDPELFLQLSAAGTNIFQSRLLNPDANRFLTVYAEKDENMITLPSLPPLSKTFFPFSSPCGGSPEGDGGCGGSPEGEGGCGEGSGVRFLFFIALPGESLHIEPETETQDSYDFPFVYPALYCLNLSSLISCRALSFNSSPFAVTVRFETPPASWPLRSWLFLNHFGVFETFLTTGRAQTSISRPENAASRYIPSLDAFHDVDLPSKPVETIKLPSGLTNRQNMQVLRHFSTSDCIYLISRTENLLEGAPSPLLWRGAGGEVRGVRLIYYLIKQSSALIFNDDAPEPISADLELTRSIREPVPPEYGSIEGDNMEMLVSPNSIHENANEGTTVCSVASKVYNMDVDWSARVTMGAAWLSVQKISQSVLHIIRQENPTNLERIGRIIATNLAGKNDSVDFFQIPSPNPLDRYIFSIKTSDRIINTQSGRYECYIPAVPTVPMVIQVASLKNGMPCLWYIDPPNEQGALLNPQFSNYDLIITPPENHSEEPCSYAITLRQDASDDTIVLVVYQDGTQNVRYLFETQILGAYANTHLHWLSGPDAVREIQVISLAGSNEAEWTVEPIRWIDGGNQWLSVTRNNDIFVMAATSTNNASEQRTAEVSIRQTDSGEIRFFFVIQVAFGEFPW